jgi:hypothetical protein
VAAEARPEAMATALHQVLVATEVQVEAPAEAALGPAPANGSRAVVVEVTDDNSPPPGWDQWVSFPTLSPESQEGVLVRRRDGHMVAGGPGTWRRSLVFSRLPLRPGGGGRRRPACVRRRPGGAGAVGGAPQPRCYARPRAERGAEGPRRPRMARLPGKALFSSFPRFCALFLYHDA